MKKATKEPFRQAHPMSKSKTPPLTRLTIWAGDSAGSMRSHLSLPAPAPSGTRWLACTMIIAILAGFAVVLLAEAIS
jgi:hypothetical protein